MSSLDQKETETLNFLALAWNSFLSLKSEHPDEIDDFRRAIHSAQRIILSRPTRRKMKSEEKNSA